MSIQMIVGTPARVHIAVPESKHSYSNGHSVVTVCGKFLVDLPETPNRINFADRGFPNDVVTCKNCRRTIAPSKVLFADESTAVVGPGQAVAAAGAAVVPASPVLGLSYEDGLWVVTIDFADPESAPDVVINDVATVITERV